MELNPETLKKAYNYLSQDDCLNHLIIKFSDVTFVLIETTRNQLKYPPRCY